jgi:hypothetical protein
MLAYCLGLGNALDAEVSFAGARPGVLSGGQAASHEGRHPAHPGDCEQRAVDPTTHSRLHTEP